MDINELIKKAENNDIEALTELAEKYRYGTDVSVDIQLSAKYAIKAANLGDTWAKLFVYTLYKDMPSLIPSYFAEKCLKEALDLGDVYAKLYMADLCYQDIDCFLNGKRVSSFNEGMDFNDPVMILANLMTCGVHLADFLIITNSNTDSVMVANKEYAANKLSDVLDFIATLIPEDTDNRLYAIAQNFFKNDPDNMDYYMDLVGFK